MIPKLPENLQRAAQDFWGFAYKEAELAFKVEREALKAEQEKWVKEKEQLVNEIEKLEIGHHSKDRRMKEILAELDRERKVHSQKDETILKISQHNSKLDPQSVAIRATGAELNELSRKKILIEAELEKVKYSETQEADVEFAIGDLKSRFEAFRRGWKKATPTAKKALTES